MNGYCEENPGICYFHPKEVVIGVCAVCLHERLLILAAKQEHGHHLHSSREPYRRTSLQSVCSSSHRRRPSLNLHKIFALGGFLNRHWKPSSLPCDGTSSSQEDSFISIKFEGDGVASWDKGSLPTASSDQSNQPWIWKTNHGSRKESKQIPDRVAAEEPPKDNLTVVEHLKHRPLLRWRKRIGYLFQFMRWRRTSKGSSCHVSTAMEGVKRKRGWIRCRSKRRKPSE